MTDRRDGPTDHPTDQHTGRGGNLQKKDFNNKKKNTLSTKKISKIQEKTKKKHYLDQEMKKENTILTKKRQSNQDLDQEKKRF